MVNPINPPDGWVVKAGTWGVDFQRDTTTVLSAGASLKMVGPSANTQTIQGPWIPLDSSGGNYVVTASVQATTTASSLFTLKLEMYASDQVTLQSTTYLYNNQAVPSALIWLTASKECTGANWARFVLTRASGQTASVYLDRVEVKKLVPRWSMRKVGGAQTLAPATDLIVDFNTTDFANAVGISSTTVWMYRAGHYLVSLRTAIFGMTAGSFVDVGFLVVDPSIGGNRIFGETRFVADAAGELRVNHNAVFHHAGTTGAGTTIKALVTGYSGAGAPSMPGNPSVFSNEVNSQTLFSGVWIGGAA